MLACLLVCDWPAFYCCCCRRCRAQRAVGARMILVSKPRRLRIALHCNVRCVSQVQVQVALSADRRPTNFSVGSSLLFTRAATSQMRPTGSSLGPRCRRACFGRTRNPHGVYIQKVLSVPLGLVADARTGISPARRTYILLNLDH